jgi:hypothetical protein
VVIACGLVTGRGLRLVLPLGLIFSLLIWVTVEGFGGPFGNGSTGMPGNMFGTAIICALLFSGLMIVYRWPFGPRTDRNWNFASSVSGTSCHGQQLLPAPVEAVIDGSNHDAAERPFVPCRNGPKLSRCVTAASPSQVRCGTG